MTFNVWIDNQLLGAHATMLRVHAIAAERDVVALFAQNVADIADNNGQLRTVLPAFAGSVSIVACPHNDFEI